MIIIAEAGINHNGNLELAKKLAYAAKLSGADAVKYQTFWDIERLKQYEFDLSEWIELKMYCDEIGITFLSTPHNYRAIHFLKDKVPFMKISSSHLGLPNFLREVVDSCKNILLSTGSLIHDNGMATVEEIRNVLSYIEDVDVTLMHCVSKYPCFNAHLERVEELEELGYRVGISDHTRCIEYDRKYPVIEKHFTLTHNMHTPDKLVSIDQEQFGRMVKCLKSL